MQNRLGNAMVMVSIIVSAVINCMIATACSSNGGEIGAATPVAYNACDGGAADAGAGQ